MEMEGRRTRPTHDRAHAMPQILTLLREGRTLREVCDTVGVTRATVWRWAQQDVGFGDFLRTAQQKGLAESKCGSVRPTEVELAYTAGFMDGEGCIRIARGRVQKNGNRYYMPSVSLCNTDRSAIQFLQDRWPGHATFGKDYGSQPNRKPVSDWRISGVAAEEFIRAIYPYLRVKRPQADLIFEFVEFLGERRRKEKKNRSPEEQAYIMDYFFRMRRLNQRGVTTRAINLD